MPQIRGRPRKYNKKDVRVRISLPKEVVQWLEKFQDHGRQCSAPEAARRVIMDMYDGQE
jgi:hypothetical protein